MAAVLQFSEAVGWVRRAMARRFRSSPALPPAVTHRFEAAPDGLDARKASGKLEDPEAMRVRPTLQDWFTPYACRGRVDGTLGSSPLSAAQEPDVGANLFATEALRSANKFAPTTDDSRDRLLLESIQAGLPLVSRPYAELGRRVGMSEEEVLAGLGRWTEAGLIKRLGVVVRHRELGYRANAMVVFDVPDERVAETGKRLSTFACVTLCYLRPRRGEDWPYNLFCMIHGKDRTKVEAQVEMLALAAGLADMPRAVLFSGRCFKQRGALYVGADGYRL